MADRPETVGDPEPQKDQSGHEGRAPSATERAKLPHTAQRPGASDQDFDQRPGFGGYGPDGGGYGSQTSYASHQQHRSPADSSEAVTHRSGTGATSSHTGTGTQTPDTATGASHGSTFGGATTVPEDLSKDEASNTDMPSRGPGSASGLAGRTVSSSSTAKPERG
jgi:hypothetical protein